MKRIHKPNKVQLVRFGGIGKQIKQKGNYGNSKKEEDNLMGFHEAPEKKGFYAFIHPFVELFLLGSPVNKKGKVKAAESGVNGYAGRFQERDARVIKKFNATGGTIWTHLKPRKGSMILEEKGAWYKVNVSDFYKIINIALATQHGESVGMGFPVGVSGSYIFSNDAFEVFVTKDTKINT